MIDFHAANDEFFFITIENWFIEASKVDSVNKHEKQCPFKPSEHVQLYQVSRIDITKRSTHSRKCLFSNVSLKSPPWGSPRIKKLPGSRRRTFVAIAAYIKNCWQIGTKTFAKCSLRGTWIWEIRGCFPFETDKKQLETIQPPKHVWRNC